jgi:hypothetical protein
MEEQAGYDMQGGANPFRSRHWLGHIANLTEHTLTRIKSLHRLTYYIVHLKTDENLNRTFVCLLSFVNARGSNGLFHFFQQSQWMPLPHYIAPIDYSNHLKTLGQCVSGGECVLSAQQTGEITKKLYADAWDLATNRNIVAIDPVIRVRHYQNLRKISDTYHDKPQPLVELNGYWIYGPSGIGAY